MPVSKLEYFATYYIIVAEAISAAIETPHTAPDDMKLAKYATLDITSEYASSHVKLKLLDAMEKLLMKTQMMSIHKANPDLIRFNRVLNNIIINEYGQNLTSFVNSLAWYQNPSEELDENFSLDELSSLSPPFSDEQVASPEEWKTLSENSRFDVSGWL